MRTAATLNTVEYIDYIDAAAGEDDNSPSQGDDEDLQDDPISQLDLKVGPCLRLQG